ncbi:MAG: GNAT family N-acetyltransferase [Bacillota bacterium]
MRILVDTNVLIPLEDTKELMAGASAELVRLANRNHCTLIVHPASLEDVERDPDTSRKRIVKSKIQKYNILEQAPVPDINFLVRVGGTSSSPNDKVDNELLFAVERNCVNFLVTEDKGIHRKAARLGLQSRVYYLEQCVSALRALYEPTDHPLPNLSLVPLHNLPLVDPIFDSLRTDYPEFDEWFSQKAREGRKAWVYWLALERLGAVCIFKTEESPLPGTLEGKTLKLSTFKVGANATGQRIGELLLKKAFQYCLDNRYRHLYLTVLPDKEHLIAFLEEFGFQEVTQRDGERWFAKSFLEPTPRPAELDPVRYNALYYPHFDCSPSVRKFIVPIQPRWHKVLFPECEKQLTFFPPQLAVSNAMRMAYLCNSQSNRVRRGDLVLFYRSHDLKGVTTLGIVEGTLRSRIPEEIAATVGKRTLFSFKDIQALCHKDTLAIQFRQILHLSRPVQFSRLSELGVVRNHVESITQLSDEGFQLLMREVQA